MPQTQSENNKTKLVFGIKQIQILDFNIDKSEKHLSLPPDHKYTFEFKVDGLLDHVQKFIGVDLKISLYASDEKDDQVCELYLRSTYHVTNYAEIVQKDENSFSIPDFAIEHLTAVSLSTARGIFFEKVQGTFLSNILIPILDITQFQKIKTPEMVK